MYFTEAIQQNIATAGWFIGILCALLFLLLIIIIVCLIKRNRGGKYPGMYARERKPRKSQERKLRMIICAFSYFVRNN